MLDIWHGEYNKCYKCYKDKIEYYAVTNKNK